MSSHLTPRLRCPALGADHEERRTAYREVFRGAQRGAPLAALRMALNRGQPVGGHGFYRESEATSGRQRALRKRGRPRKTKRTVQLVTPGKKNDRFELIEPSLALPGKQQFMPATVTPDRQAPAVKCDALCIPELPG